MILLLLLEIQVSYYIDDQSYLRVFIKILYILRFLIQARPCSCLFSDGVPLRLFAVSDCDQPASVSGACNQLGSAEPVLLH